MIRLKEGGWLAVHTISDNRGYVLDASGGTKLRMMQSRDERRTWHAIAELAHPARDLDNGQFVEIDNGELLLGCRSVRRQESYQLSVYKSKDGGRSWAFWSIAGERNGAPGSVDMPDTAGFAAQFGSLPNGKPVVLYTVPAPNGTPLVIRKISHDGGRSWTAADGDEKKIAHR